MTTLQTNPKTLNLLNDATPVGRLPIVVSHALKKINLTDKYLMENCSQEPPSGTDYNLNFHNSRKNTFNSLPNKTP